MTDPYKAPDTIIDIAKGGMVDVGVLLASRWSRLGAAIIDNIIGALVSIALVGLVFDGQSSFEVGRVAETEVQINFLQLLIETVMGWALFLAIHGYYLKTKGQTFGKMLLKIQMVDYHTENILDLMKIVTLRYVPLWIIGLVLSFCIVKPEYTPYGSLLAILLLVNYLFIFGPEKRCIHDYIAGTKVVDYDADSVFNDKSQ